jgi:2-C-methyl-D-erythritol 2,4-cyclodiphosphate synthase
MARAGWDRSHGLQRVGIGYDIHPLTSGRELWLGGVEIDYPRGLGGHSDGDALAHAVADAMLGAAALGDIGTHFPESDARWKDAPGRVILGRTVEILAEAGWRVASLDANILAEAPRLAPFIDEMRRHLAAALGLETSCVSVKARTGEGMGPVGRGEAIVCQAVVVIEPVGRRPGD